MKWVAPAEPKGQPSEAGQKVTPLSLSIGRIHVKPEQLPRRGIVVAAAVPLSLPSAGHQARDSKVEGCCQVCAHSPETVTEQSILEITSRSSESHTRPSSRHLGGTGVFLMVYTSRNRSGSKTKFNILENN